MPSSQHTDHQLLLVMLYSPKLTILLAVIPLPLQPSSQVVRVVRRLVYRRTIVVNRVTKWIELEVLVLGYVLPRHFTRVPHDIWMGAGSDHHHDAHEASEPGSTHDGCNFRMAFEEAKKGESFS